MYIDTMSSAILYIGYFIGSYPCSLLGQMLPIRQLSGALIFLWGTCLILTVACKNYQGLFAQRFFLGFLEGGISPIFMIVVGGWYTKGVLQLLHMWASRRIYLILKFENILAEQAWRMGVWSSPLSSVS